MRPLLGALFFAATAAIDYSDVAGSAYTTTYDQRSFLINDEPVLLLSGSIHYNRASPEMWPDILAKARANGLNHVQIYVFWNYHEHTRGNVTFEGDRNLSAFLEAAGKANLFVNLRIGPYVCSEWTWGGLPLWLQTISNMSVRTNNDPFKTEMERWVKRVVAEVRPLFADRGGPIIMTQLENEYSPKTDEDFAYVAWVGQLSRSLGLTVPLVMCNGAADGDNGAIESCNSCDCEGWLGKHFNATPGADQLKLWGKQNDKPAMWTENWMGWNSRWGWAKVGLEAADKAFSTAVFLAAGGAYNNYYMWFSGNNYGYYAGPAITTAYGDEPALHNDGAPHEPMYSHLGRMHRAFAANAGVLLCQPPPPKTSLHATAHAPGRHRPKQHRTALVSGGRARCGEDSGADGPTLYAYEYAACGGHSAVAFLVNRGDADATVHYQGASYILPPGSLAMLAHDGSVVWRTDDVSGPVFQDDGFRRASVSFAQWQGFKEPGASAAGHSTVVHADHVVEQLSVTNDTSPYLFYEVVLPTSATVGEHTLTLPTLNAQAFAVFVDEELATDVFDAEDGLHEETVLTAKFKTTKQGQRLSILSVSLGVPNFYPSSFVMWKGLRPDDGDYGPPLLDNELMNGTGWSWSMRPGLQGEWLRAFANTPDSAVRWSAAAAKVHTPKTWFKSSFPTPANVTGGGVGVHLNLTGFSRGHTWVNGHNIGRMWNISGSCSPPGEWMTFCEDFLDDDCDKPTQSLYHVPEDWLSPAGSANQVVVFDELGATDLSLPSVSVRTLLPGFV